MDRLSRALIAALALVWLLILPSGLWAQESEPLDQACSNEIGILCPGRNGRALRRCLDDFLDAATPRCRSALAAQTEAAPPPKAAPQAAEEGEGAGEEREARLTRVDGAVYVHTADQAEGEFVKAEAGMPLEDGDLVRTGSDGSAEVTLDGESEIGRAHV